MRAGAGRRAASVVVLAAALWASAAAAPAAAATPDVADYVDGAYRALLDRGASAQEIAPWLPVIEQEGPLALTGFLAGSPEWDRRRLVELYREALGRAPDAGGLDHWGRLLAADGDLELVAAALYGSDEYRAAHGTTHETLVDALYRAVLGRGADAGGHAFWTQQLAGGTPASTVAAHLRSSPEGRIRRAQQLHERFVGRSAGPEAVRYWADRLLHAGRRSVEADLVAADEVYARLTGTTPLDVVVHNLAGWKAHAGDLAPATTVVERVAAAAVRPLAVAVVETCATGDTATPGQWEHLRRELAPLGYRFVWAPSIDAFGRAGCEQFGNGLAVLGTVGRAVTHDFAAQRTSPANPTPEIRNIACAELVTGDERMVTACVTHLVNRTADDQETTRQQAAEALRFVEQRTTTPRLVAADMNLDPTDPALDRWYASHWAVGGPGAPHAPTTDRGTTTDYLFVDRHRFSSVTDSVIDDVATSDHHWVLGTVRALP